MKKENKFTKISLYFLMFFIIIFVINFISIQITPTVSEIQHFILQISPCFFALIGEIFSLIGLKQNSTRIVKSLCIVNFILLFWPLIFAIGGPLLFGI